MQILPTVRPHHSLATLFTFCITFTVRKCIRKKRKKRGWMSIGRLKQYIRPILKHHHFLESLFSFVITTGCIFTVKTYRKKKKTRFLGTLSFVITTGCSFTVKTCNPLLLPPPKKNTRKEVNRKVKTVISFLYLNNVTSWPCYSPLLLRQDMLSPSGHGQKINKK